jgi:hypothetical protein
LAFVADFETLNFNFKNKFDMENKTLTNHENGNDANRLLPAVSLTLEQIEQELNSEIDYMLQCVQDSMGTIDPDKDIQDIETARRVIKSLFNGVEYRVRNGR